MIWIYLASLLFGGAFVIPMVLGGLDFGGDVELDFDADGDVGGGLDADGFDAELDGFDSGDSMFSAVGDFVSSMLSFRSIVFFTAFFGLAGSLFTLVGVNVVGAAFVAAALGLAASAANTALFRYIIRSEVDSTFTNSDLSGRPAKVVVPLGPGRKGRIRIDVAGQPQYMVAEAYPGSKDMCDVGDSVVVVEIENSTALVAPLMELEGEEL